MPPRVILHNAISLDGCLSGFAPDLGQYYGVVSTWREDATLVGSETILTAPEGTSADPDDEPPLPSPGDNRPLLVVADSRGRVRCWQVLRNAGYWRDMVALCSRSTPRTHTDWLRSRRVHTIIAGEIRVDLPAALRELAERFDVHTIRVDSGGTLNGSLLREGLVSEISVVIHPCIVGRAEHAILVQGALPVPAGLRLLDMQTLPGGLVWLRYEIAAPVGGWRKAPHA